ncbi:MAG: phosphoenolpyruvate--protein phosphotransferase [Candidatus Omnitrophica bacterium]|nr:phosphoenolpyruvate--protein phosphotransferase [Candidatus Omnitrophota bacterium]
MELLKGIPAAPGIAAGKLVVLKRADYVVHRREIAQADLNPEIERFRQALSNTHTEIQEIYNKVGSEIGDAESQIFQAHLLLLDDQIFIEEIVGRIRQERLSAEYVLSDVLQQYVSAFSRIDDAYLKERASDIDDIGKRILRHLLGIPHHSLQNLNELSEPSIIVAHDLTPSETAVMDKTKVLAFATDVGGPTSHTAIIAKSLEIPAVVGLGDATERLNDGARVIVDGYKGVVYLEPDEALSREYKETEKRLAKLERGLLQLRDLPSESLDGRCVNLSANIELPEEVSSVIEHGAEGIGLYRTEFLYMNRKELPDEEEQLQCYQAVARRLCPKPVIIRTIDLGGDKLASLLALPDRGDMESYRGWRAIRFCLAHPGIFKIQLRAILRASVHCNIQIMYPMISGLEELQDANGLLEEAKQELRDQEIPFDEHLQVGAMIEVPSAVLAADILAKEVSFFSIGTNDLIQYALAVDRLNEKTAYLYEPTHPAILRMIQHVVKVGHENNLWVGMCGEMAAMPACALLLLGLGMDELSVSAAALPEIKRIIRNANYEQAKLVAEKALSFPTGKGVLEYLQTELKKLSPEPVEEGA